MKTKPIQDQILFGITHRVRLKKVLHLVQEKEFSELIDHLTDIQAVMQPSPNFWGVDDRNMARNSGHRKRILFCNPHPLFILYFGKIQYFRTQWVALLPHSFIPGSLVWSWAWACRLMSFAASSCVCVGFHQFLWFPKNILLGGLLTLNCP